ncbi:telomerase reverse transcriptase [Anabrus simplex]|uniref:telomerase reverse transcriptase n=1 Tax=Anabrus simplex TaxID=316456 RepID=UPI0035A3272E
MLHVVVINVKVNKHWMQNMARRRQTKRSLNWNTDDSRPAFKGNIPVKLPRLHTSNFTEVWPKNHVLGKNVIPAHIFIAVTKQDVGVDLNLNATEESFIPLMDVFRVLIRNHKRKSPYKQYLEYFIHTKKHLTVAHSPFETSIVYEYLRDLVKSVVPFELFGSRENQKCFINFIKQVLTAGRGQIIHLQQLISGQKYTKPLWLRKIPSQIVKQHLYSKVLLWLVEQYVLVIIGVHFYVTETASGKYELLFYWKRVWQSITYRAYNDMKQAEKVKEITPSNTAIIESKTSMPALSSLRFLPKENGARPLLRPREKNISRSLQDASDLLHTLFDKKMQEGNFKDAKDLSQYWHRLHAWWRENGQPQLYFVRVDIMDAYGSVKQEVLKKILQRMQKDWLPKDGKAILKVARLTYMEPRPRVKIHTFFENLTSGIDKNYCSIFLFPPREVNTKYLLGMVNRQIKWQHFNMHGHHIRLARGLSQGTKFSAILCKLYLTDMDSKYLSEFNTANDVLLRSIDDYLYITPDKERAEKFLNTMKTGIPEYGCQINEKTQTNLYNGCNKISYHGYVLDTKTLEVESDYSCYKGQDIAYTMCLNVTSRPGKFVKKRLQQLALLKLNSLLVDRRINSFHTVVKNVFQACLLLAFRLHCLRVRVLSKHQLNQQFLMACVCCTGKKINSWLWLITRSHRTADSQKYAMIGLWLFYQAVRIKLQMHSKMYGHMLRKLRKLLSHLEKKIPLQVQRVLQNITTEIAPIFKTLK